MRRERKNHGSLFARWGSHPHGELVEPWGGPASSFDRLRMRQGRSLSSTPLPFSPRGRRWRVAPD